MQTAEEMLEEPLTESEIAWIQLLELFDEWGEMTSSQ